MSSESTTSANVSSQRPHSHNDALPKLQDDSHIDGANLNSTHENSDELSRSQPTRSGGVAIDGSEGLPARHVTMADKVVGKAKQVIGKMTHNSDMQEGGELRETGGEAAALGEARVPLD